MNANTGPRQTLNRMTLALPLAVTALIIAGCSSSPMPAGPTMPSGSVSSTPSSTPPATPNVQAPSPMTTPPKPSLASTPREYRRDGAGHLYARNSNRIYKGKLPAMLYAIGVLEIELDARGNVRSTSWLRAPKHAPEVIEEIERTARLAAPYPAPARMGRVTYTETWLWDKSGNFQLDTLTEGQL
jgi:protein TonB